MMIRAQLSVSCVLLLCAAAIADDPQPVAPNIKVIKAVPADKAVQLKVQVQAVKAVANVRAVVQVQGVDKKTLEAQQKASQEYAAARKAVTDLTKDLQDVQKAAEAADGDAEKAEALKKVDAAKAKLEKARKDLAAKQQALQKIAVQAAAQRVYIPAAQKVRTDVDVNDATERFILLNPGGPLVVETSMTVDGKPFRTARESLVDELLAAADKDKDGKPTWDEALSSTRFTMGRIRIINDEQRAKYVTGLDTNGNKIVDRVEVRQFLAMYFQGPSFMLSGSTANYRSGFAGGVVVFNGGFYPRNGQADVRKLLDKNDDGELSADEIAGAAERLKSRDADDNDLLMPAEINGTPNRAAGNRVVRSFRTTTQVPLTVLLGPTADAASVFAAIQARYKDKDGNVVAAGFAKEAELFKTLDKNANGKLEQSEVLALNTVKPHVRLSLALGSNEKSTQSLKVESVATDLKEAKVTATSANVEMEGINLTFAANTAAPRSYNYSQTAQSYLTRFDKDANGYLDKKELAGNYAYMLQMWDADEDGKVYPKEIVATYERMQAPQRTQIRANAANQGNSLFAALDASGDGRLSLREMRTAHERIKTFDKNKDGKVSEDEIPDTVAVSFGLGNTGNWYGTQRGQNPNQAAKSDAPDWFTRMDRNGDGDVTLKEFLGDEAAFKQLDTNNDGFIEPKEAKVASKDAESTKQTDKK
ncbi:MAG: hypothetical protein O3A00_02650 [Planctomycetota bacterium]|nr:hypothetical protein [Planctomycetota bacterium]